MPRTTFGARVVLALASGAIAAPHSMQQGDSPLWRRGAISNVEPRRTASGDIVNAHDGALYNFEGQWVLIGTSYFHCESFTNCSSHIGDCGWQNNNFSVYTGTTPAGPWKLASGNILPNRPSGGAYFRPKLIYDHTAKHYVLWFNFQPPTPNIPGYYTVATSTNFSGPFTIITNNVRVAQPLNGDFALFQDDDADRTAYIAYNSDKNGGDNCGACHIPPCDCGFQMSVEKLNPGYTSSSLENSGFVGAPRVEAPAMFKRRGLYYLLFDRLSCFGPQGSGAVVYTARSPLGPYTALDNINRYGPFRESQLGFIIVPAQQTFVVQVNGTYIWQGDMWDSYTDRSTGRNDKAYDYQVWPTTPAIPQVVAVHLVLSLVYGGAPVRKKRVYFNQLAPFRAGMATS